MSADVGVLIWATSDDPPDISWEHLLQELLKSLGAPYFILLVVSVVTALLGWKELVKHTADSYVRANKFVQRKRRELAWQLPVLAFAQVIFVMGVYSLTELYSWWADHMDGYVHKSKSLTQWAQIAI